MSVGRESRRVADQVAHWTPARWRFATDDTGAPTRAQAARTLIQTLADLAADAEGRPRRVVPRLPHDTALPDQLRVVGDDLDAADPDPATVAAARAAVAAAREVLFRIG